MTCFAPFHNVNCEHGFLYFSSTDELRVCTLPTTLSYDNHWPAKKVPLRSTPHFVAYHHDTKTLEFQTFFFYYTFLKQIKHLNSAFFVVYTVN